MMRVIAFVFIASIVTSVACTKTYDCQCSVDGPDTLGISLDFDTTLQVTGRFEQEAVVKCEGFQEAQSLLGIQIPIEGAEDVAIDCSLN